MFPYDNVVRPVITFFWGAKNGLTPHMNSPWLIATSRLFLRPFFFWGSLAHTHPIFVTTSSNDYVAVIAANRMWYEKGGRRRLLLLCVCFFLLLLLGFFAGVVFCSRLVGLEISANAKRQGHTFCVQIVRRNLFSLLSLSLSLCPISFRTTGFFFTVKKRQHPVLSFIFFFSDSVGCVFEGKQ